MGEQARPAREPRVVEDDLLRPVLELAAQAFDRVPRHDDAAVAAPAEILHVAEPRTEPVDGRPDLSIRVFTTRPDTVFGMTYAVLAPEHPLVDQIVRDADERETVARFRSEVSRQSEIERTAADRPKRGLRLGAKVVNPFNSQPVPLFIADYVLMGYGTGAIMAVPGEDERDWEFAEQHGLPIIETVKRLQRERGYDARPIGMTYLFPVADISRSNEPLFRSPADWISPGFDEPMDPNADMSAGPPPSHWYTDPPEGDGRKVLIADSDHFSPMSADALWPWKAFTRGQNPILYDLGIIGGVNPDDPTAGPDRTDGTTTAGAPPRLERMATGSAAPQRAAGPAAPAVTPARRASCGRRSAG